MITPTAGIAARNVPQVNAVKKEPAHSIAPVDSPTARAAVRMSRSTPNIAAIVRQPARRANYVPRVYVFQAAVVLSSIVADSASIPSTTHNIVAAVMWFVTPDMFVLKEVAS